MIDTGSPEPLVLFVFIQCVVDSIEAADNNDTETLIPNLQTIRQVITQMKNTLKNIHGTLFYITNLVCYTYFHWFHNPECQYIFGKQTGYIFQFPKTIKAWTTKHYASLNQWYNTNKKCIFTKLNAVFILKTAA